MTDVKVKLELQSDGEDNEIDIETDSGIVERDPVESLNNGPFTNFSIEEILKPEFGMRKKQNTFSQTNSQRASPKEQDENQSPGSNSVGPLPLPAWVYCTRYSDRPSSGKSIL